MHNHKHKHAHMQKCAGARTTIFLAAASLVWFILRTGTKPSRIVYPCQRAAIINLHTILVSLPYMLGFISLSSISKLKSKQLVLIALLISATIGGTAVWSFYNNRFHNTATIDSPVKSTVFVVNNFSTTTGSTALGWQTLFALMSSHDIQFLSGIIDSDDIIVIKVNCQWNQRGGTNTDLMEGMINEIVNQPNWSGEIIIADNGQGVGSLDWPQSNAYLHDQSMQDVADAFSNQGFEVSTFLWDTIRTITVHEYEAGDFQDGYVFDHVDSETGLQVRYPKFRTRYGTYISLKNGIWDPQTNHYNDTNLKLINLPVLKSHGYYGVTGAVKHYMGVITYASSNHGALRLGGMGVEMAEVRFPNLNIMDMIYVMPAPVEYDRGGTSGAGARYDQTPFTNIIAASIDPIALDVYSSREVLIPTALEEGYVNCNSLDPYYEEVTPGLSDSFHNYLENSFIQLLNRGFNVTMNTSNIQVLADIVQ